MKKSGLFALVIALLITNVTVRAQVSSLYENFNVSCATPTGFPSGWLLYNPISTTTPDGAWHCTATNGRADNLGSPTPGITCTDVWSGGFHLDTSYLITPQLLLSSYTNAYLHFDTKADSITAGGKLYVLITADSGAPSTFFYVDSTSSVTPTFSVADSVGWVTHEANLSSYCGVWAQPIYIAFRYVAPATSGSAWYLDNVNISSVRLNVPGTGKEILPLTVLGASSPSHIALSVGSRGGANINMVITDLMGRVVHHEILNVNGGSEVHNIDDLNLAPGMYFIKAGNGNSYGVTKVIIQ